MVNDDEKLAKELMDLKRKLRDVYSQNDSLNIRVRTVQNNLRDTEADRDQVMLEKKMMLNPRSGKLEAFNVTYAAKVKKSAALVKYEDIPDYEKQAKE